MSGGPGGRDSGRSRYTFHGRGRPDVPGGASALTNHRDGVAPDGDFHSRFLLASFGDTFCPDICPTPPLGIPQVLDPLGGEAEYVRALVVSADPERDTAELRAEHVANHLPGIVGPAGTAEQVRAAAEADSVHHEEAKSGEPGNGGDRLVDHGAVINLMLARGPT